jgi:hypothetical protein
MASKGATVSTFESLVADGDRSWDVPARLDLRARHVLLIAAAWSVLVGCILFPALQLAVLGTSALVASLIETAREND